MLDKINANMSIGARLALVSGLFVASSAIVAAFFVLQALSQINNYVAKPFTAATLKSRIEAVFGALT